MNERKLRKNIRRLLFEDHWVANATDDKSAGKFAADSDETELPVETNPQMSFQVSVDAPPINDENYIPASTVDLAKAMHELFKDTPQDQIEYVYRNAHRLRITAEEKSKHFKTAEPEIDDSIPLQKPIRKSTKKPQEKL